MVFDRPQWKVFVSGLPTLGTAVEWTGLSILQAEAPDIIYQTVIRPTLLYGCETWPLPVKDEKRLATTEMGMAVLENGAMGNGVSLSAGLPNRNSEKS